MELNAHPVGAGNDASFPDYFWAKTTKENQPGISVRDHCLNVGCVAEALIASLPCAVRALLPPGAASLAALHDVGKITPGFQQKCPAWMAHNNFPPQAAETDHAKVSQWFFQQWFQNEARKIKRWLMAIGAHHGQSKGPWIYPVSLRGTTGTAEWQDARQQLADELETFFGESLRDALRPNDAPPNDAVLGMFAGLVAVADWIGSNEDFFSPLPDKSVMLSEARRSLAAKAISAIGLDVAPTARTTDFPSLFPPLRSANALQKLAVEHCGQPGLWIIEAPMGCGKTEAALLAASLALADGKARGLYFALPTQTTSNRIHDRVSKWLKNLLEEGSLLRLAHGASWLERNQTLHVRPASQADNLMAKSGESENPWAAMSWFSSGRRALLTPFGVGTVDQALLGVVAAKHFFVRLFGLAGKVVILDEVHSYDLYTGTLLDLLVEQLVQLRCTVIVLSATLTRDRREKLLGVARRALSKNAPETSPLSQSSAYPLLSGVTMDGTIVELPVQETVIPKPPIRLRCSEVPFEQAAAACVERAEAGQVVLWIRNTVDGAQRSLDAVRNARRDKRSETALLHSRFPWFRRDELEATWLARLGKTATDRPKGAVIVATQVVEQSVDIDADFLITDLAPTDMLLQRLGRMWRHERPERPNRSTGPEAWINAPDSAGLEDIPAIKACLKGLAPPYAVYVLLRSAREWQRYTKDGILLPEDIRGILEATYAPWPEEPAAWIALRKEMEGRADKLRNKAVGASNAWALPALADDEGVQTRYSDYATATLVLLRDFNRSGFGVEFNGLDGTPAKAREREWLREAAVALHRNHVKVPAWWLRGRELEHPPALKPYFGGGQWALATVEGENVWLNGCIGESSGLKCNPDRGVWREPEAGQPPSPDYDDDYESDN